MEMLNTKSFIGPLLLLFICSACNKEIERSIPELTAGDGYVEVEGGKIWYGIMGGGDKTPILCLHGGPGGTSKGYYHLSEIAKERPVIMFDQLGSGNSRHHQDTSLLKVEKFVEQVKAIEQELNLSEYYLIGSSWGSALALEYYSTYPDHVKALIFSSPYFSTPIWTNDADILIAALPDSIQQVIRKAEADSVFDSEAYTKADSIFASRHGRRKASIKHPFDTTQSKRNAFIYNYMWGPSEFTATGILRDFDNHKHLKDIQVPTLFTTGEFDEARPETVEGFSRMVPNSRFAVIPDAGHATLNDNRPAMLNALKEFLGSLEL